MRAPRPPQTMVTMLGLNRSSFRIAVTMVMVVYVAVGLLLPDLHQPPLEQTVAIAGSVGLAVALWLTARGDEDPIRLTPTVVAVLLGAASAAAVWWSLPAGPGNWVRPGAPFVAYAIAVILVAVRGRIVWAWIGLVLTSATAVVAMTMWGWGSGTAAQVAVRMLVSLVPVILVMAFVRPLLTFSRVLDRREIAAVEAEAAQAGTAQQRRRQLADLNDDVRPILEKVAAGEEISVAEAARAHLLEYALRDGVRGAGWMSPQVGDAVNRARRRGVEVRVFDDRTATCARQFDVDVLRAELVAVLDDTADGAVTARLLPRGRDAVAVIAVNQENRVHRSYCRVAGSGHAQWEDENGGAASM